MTSPVVINAADPILAANFDAYENATGNWSTWSPTYANITAGNATVVARYRQVGKTVDYRFVFTLGSTSAIGTNPEFSLPATPHGTTGNFEEIGRGRILDASAGAGRQAQAAWITANVRARVSFWDATPNAAGITATAPWTWAVGDAIEIRGTFEVA